MKKGNHRILVVSKGEIKKALREIIGTHLIMQNAEHSWPYRGIALDYWEKFMGRKITTWTCPHCNKQFKRDDLDGAHVVQLGNQNGKQWITPICKMFNESKDYSTPFLVKKSHLVDAPIETK